MEWLSEQRHNDHATLQQRPRMAEQLLSTVPVGDAGIGLNVPTQSDEEYSCPRDTLVLSVVSRGVAFLLDIVEQCIPAGIIFCGSKPFPRYLIVG